MKTEQLKKSLDQAIDGFVFVEMVGGKTRCSVDAKLATKLESVLDRLKINGTYVTYTR